MSNLTLAKPFYRPELDVLRFVAFLLVFVHHLPVYPSNRPAIVVVLRSMRCGLSLFFLLSAYLITELLLRERETTGSVHIKAFFVRRALRIWPLYFLAIVVSYILGHLSHSWHTPLRALPYMLLLAMNIYIAHFGWQFSLIAPLWSLSIEEQFYLVIPSIAKFRGGELRYAAFICIAVSYGVLAWLGYKHTALVDVIWVNSFVQFQFFAAGTLLALFLHQKRFMLSWVNRSILLVGGCGLIALSERFFHLFWPTSASLPGVVVGYAMFLTGTIAFFLAFLSAPLRIPAWLTYLGRISYGLYVVHGFSVGVELAVFHWEEKHGRHLSVPLAHLVSLIPTILLAALSFRYFEQPILKLKKRFTYVKSGATA